MSAVLVETLNNDLVVQLRRVAEQYRKSKVHFERAYSNTMAESAAVLQRWAQHEKFRQAITWQNLTAMHTAVDAVAAGSSSSRAKHRKRQELIARYLQRYSTKNDTIGFFGPVAWATWNPAHTGAQLTHGREQLDRREVFFEDWTIQALADKLRQSSDLLPWFIPARAPYLLVQDNKVIPPAGSVFPLSERQALVWSACDGVRNCQEVAAALMSSPIAEFSDASAIYAELSEMARLRRISLGFSVAIGDARPEQRLRAQLESVSQPDLRLTALTGLDELERARRRVASSVHNSASLAEALKVSNEIFERLTGSVPLRHHGETYGARSILYEDCRRDMSISFGTDVLKQILEPLSLVLSSARWYVSCAAQCYRASLAHAFENVIGRQAAKCPSERSVRLPTFWLSVQHLFFEDQDDLLDNLDTVLAERWKAILQLSEDQRAVNRISSELAEEVNNIFETANDSWTVACHHSPDVMICAESSEAICAGDFTAVLGEVHVGVNTLMTSALFHQHPDCSQLLHALGQDVGSIRVLPLLSTEGTRQPIRTKLITDVMHDLEVRISLEAQPQAPERAMLMSDFVVEDQHGSLVVRSTDGHYLFDVVDFFGHLLSQIVAGRFRILPLGKHLPRVTIDKLVVYRETWRIRCSDLSFVEPTDEATVFGSLRRWQKEISLPRFVFVKMSWEAKPIYLDFASPVQVQMFARQIRNSRKQDASKEAELSISEMLPAHDQLWFSERGGTKRYTSELRFVALHVKDVGFRSFCRDSPTLT